MTALFATTHPRVGLLGNPSDLYGGKVLGFTFDAFQARVTLEQSERFELCGPQGVSVTCRDLHAACTELDPRTCENGSELLVAALRRFAQLVQERIDLRTLGARGVLRMTFTTDIPRQVGLSGSSAIIVATLRVLAQHLAQELAPFDLAEQALAAETEELGIVAGPQDRVLQAYGGFLHMDFASPREPGRYTRLDPALLPPLFVAWDPEPGESSGAVHNEVRRRWENGDEEIRATIARFSQLVDTGLAALERGDVADFARCVDANFDTRASIWPICARDRELVDIGRQHGASVKFCGSGGAVVGVLERPADRRDLAVAYEGAGYRILDPRPISTVG